MGSKTPATTTQQQNTTTTQNPWSAATPLLQNIINSFSGLSTAITPAQQAAGTGLTTAAGDLTSAAQGGMPAAQALSPAAAGLTPAAQQVAGSTGNLAGAAQNVAQSAGGLTPAAAAFGPAAWWQTPAAYNMMNTANALPSFAPQSTQAVQQLFQNAGMLPAAYLATQSSLSPIANMSANPYQTPGFSDALDTLTQNITSNVKGAYAASGRSPSGAGTMPQTLARGLMQGEAPILQSQYNTNLGNIMSAAGMLQNAGISTASGLNNFTTGALQNAGLLPSSIMAPATAQWQAAQAPLQAAQAGYTAAGMPLQAAQTQYGAATQPYQAALTNYAAAGQPLTAAQTQWQAAQAPYTQAQMEWAAAQAPWTAANQIYQQPFSNINQLLAPAATLGGMGGTTTGTGTATGTQTPANDPMSNILGGVAGTAGLIGSLFPAGGTAATALGPMLLAGLSERSEKEDIKPIGKTFDKQNIYSFRFKGHPMPQIGMMADEVEKKTPQAVVRGPDNLRRVNYDLATRKAQTMGMLSKMAA